LAMDLCNKASFIFKVLNKKSHEIFATGLAANLKKSIRNKLIDFESMTVDGNCQTSQAMAIHYGAFEPEERDKAFEKLMEIIKSDGNVMNVGIIGGRVLFHVLANFGRADLAFDMIIGPEYPSYGYFAEHGATTLFENFFSDLNDVKSMNHHFWGDISNWFIRHLAGLSYRESKLEIRPNFIDKLDSASAYYLAPEGKIETSWERLGDKIHLKVAAPNTVQGTIRPSAGYIFEDGTNLKKASSGEYVLMKKR